MGKRLISTISAGRATKHFELPVITCISVCELLEEKGFTIASVPRNGRYLFRWYDEYDAVGGLHLELEEDQVLHMRTAEAAAEDFSSGLRGLMVVACEDDRLPSELEPYRSRIIHVVCADEHERRSLRLATQEIFIQMLEWENRLHFITETNGSLKDLLNVGASMFDSVIFLIGIDHHIVGCSTVVDYPNDEYRHMLTQPDGPVVKDISLLMAKERNKRDNDPAVSEDIDQWGNTCLSFPIIYNGSHFGMLVLVRSGAEGPSSRGYRDQFRRFSEYAITLAGRLWGDGVEQDMPHYYFFTSMLQGNEFTNSYIESNLHQMGISVDSCYKVYCARFAQQF